MASTANNTANCRPDAGGFKPQIDRALCEAKSVCERVCPYDVFQVRRLAAAESAGLSFFNRIKLAMHGGMQSVVVAPADCHACTLCVQSCPKDAITLIEGP